MNLHIHKFKFDTEFSCGHTHRVYGLTDNMLGISVFHFHFFYGVSSYNDHTHYYSGFTGLPIKTKNGHIHKIEGTLELNNSHEHKFTNYTHEEISYTQDSSTQEATI